MPSAAEIDEHRQSAAAQELDSAQRVREGYGQLDNPVPYPMDSIMVLRGHSGEVSYVKLAGRHVISAASDGAVKVRGASADSWCSCDPSRCCAVARCGTLNRGCARRRCGIFKMRERTPATPLLCVACAYSVT